MSAACTFKAAFERVTMPLKRKFSIGLSAVLLVVVLLFCTGRAAINILPTIYAQTGSPTYSTSFPLTENPISEGGNWISGAAAGGNLWGNVQTTPGFAFGVTEPTIYGDPTAILNGSWGTSQQIHAVIKINNQPASCCHEIEVRLLSAISSGRITGYEINYSAVPSEKYVQLVRWNGANGNFTILDQAIPSTAASNGDTIDATATVSGGTVTFTYKINGLAQTFAEIAVARVQKTPAVARSPAVILASVFTIMLTLTGILLATLVSPATWSQAERSRTVAPVAAPTNLITNVN